LILADWGFEHASELPVLLQCWDRSEWPRKRRRAGPRSAQCRCGKAHRGCAELSGPLCWRSQWHCQAVIFWITSISIEEVRELFWRGVFWTHYYTAATAGILGVVAIDRSFGLQAMYVVVFLLFLLCIWLERRRPVYFDSEPFVVGGDSALPPPGKQAQPPAGARQITRANQALTKYRLALLKKAPKCQETLNEELARYACSDRGVRRGARQSRSVICSPSRVAGTTTALLVLHQQGRQVTPQ
jgi:hypothetical protein